MARIVVTGHAFANGAEPLNDEGPRCGAWASGFREVAMRFAPSMRLSGLLCLTRLYDFKEPPKWGAVKLRAELAGADEVLDGLVDRAVGDAAPPDHATAGLQFFKPEVEQLRQLDWISFQKRQINVAYFLADRGNERINRRG